MIIGNLPVGYLKIAVFIISVCLIILLNNVSPTFLQLVFLFPL